MKIDLDKIELLPAESRRLFAMRFNRRVKREYLGRYFDHLYEIEFIQLNRGKGYTSFGAPVYDGTCSLTDTYSRYCIRRRRKFFEGSVWPCILSGVVSLVVSLLVAYLTQR